jgi:hypothetical protein
MQHEDGFRVSIGRFRPGQKRTGFVQSDRREEPIALVRSKHGALVHCADATTHPALSRLSAVRNTPEIR